MKKLGIRPFVIDPQTMDLALGEGSFFEELKDSLKAGYDSTKPIIVAKSDDDMIDGQIIDGRHRCYVLTELKKQGVPLPSPFPISYVQDVRDADHLRALIAQYESRSQSKGAKYARAHIERNLRAIIRDNADRHSRDLPAFIKSLGFTNDTITSKVVDDYMGPSKKKLKNQPKVRHVSAGLPESLAGAWPQDKEVPTSASVYADKDEDFNIKISYHNCPQCKSLLKVSANDKTGSVRIEAAPVIEK